MGSDPRRPPEVARSTIQKPETREQRLEKALRGLIQYLPDGKHPPYIQLIDDAHRALESE